MIPHKNPHGKIQLFLTGTLLIGLLFVQNGLFSMETTPQMRSYPSGKAPTSPHSADATREERLTYSNINLVNDSSFNQVNSPWNVTYNSTSVDIDMAGKIQGNAANTTVIGNQSTFTLAEVPGGAGWTKMQNPFYISDLYPVGSSNDGVYGCHANHDWSEDANQAPSVWWVKNVAAPVNMTDYEIVSANVSAIINATVSTNIDVINYNYDVPEGTNPANPQGPPYDYVRFYLKIANPSLSIIRECAWNRTYNLGFNNVSLSVLSMINVYLDKEVESTLIDFLNQVLAENYRNFYVIVGIDFYCADNCWSDQDTWTELHIKYTSLNFTCQKKINPDTKITWAETGYRLNRTAYQGAPENGLAIENFNATFNFDYNLTQNWPSNGQNAEIRIYINELLHSETIKLDGLLAGTAYEIKGGAGFGVSSLVEWDKNVTIKIEVIMLDANFLLSQNHSMYIDNVNLTVEFVAVLQIPIPNTQLKLTGSTNIASPWNENFTVTANYTLKDSPYTGIAGANITIGWIGGSYWVKDIGGGYYEIICNTSLTSANQQYTLQIDAEYFGYESRSYTADIQITGRQTHLHLFLNGQAPTLPEITVAWNETVNITTFYHDAISGAGLNGATVGLSGADLNPNAIDPYVFDSEYQFLVNSSYFEVGSHYISLLASLANYSASSVLITVKVTARSTFLSILRNSINVTQTSELNVPITGSISLNLNYSDTDLGKTLDDYNVSLQGLASQFYTIIPATTTNIIIDTDGLTLGVHIISVIVGKTNYTQLSRSYQINVNQIQTSIVPDKITYTVSPNGDLEITVTITDTDFSVPIMECELTYTWRFGTGTFVETSPGVYKTTIKSIPEGENPLYISAYKDLNYHFESKTITIVAIQTGEGLPPWVMWLLIGAMITLSVLFIQYQLKWKYPPHIRKLRMINRSLKKGKLDKIGANVTFRSADASFTNTYLDSTKQVLSVTAQNQLKSKYLTKNISPTGAREIETDFAPPTKTPKVVQEPTPVEPVNPPVPPTPSPEPQKVVSLPEKPAPKTIPTPVSPPIAPIPERFLKLIKETPPAKLSLPQVKELPTKPVTKPVPKPEEKPAEKSGDNKE